MAERRRRISRDPLGLRRALSDRLLPGLVGAMALLAALALAGAQGADRLADRWQAGAAAAVTAQVPDPTRERMAAAIAVLREGRGVASATAVEPERVAELLRNLSDRSDWLEKPMLDEIKEAMVKEADRTAGAGQSDVRRAYEFTLNVLIKRRTPAEGGGAPGAPAVTSAAAGAVSLAAAGKAASHGSMQ